MASYNLGLNVGSKEIMTVGAVLAGLIVLGFVLNNSGGGSTANTRFLGGDYKSVTISGV